MISVTDKDCPAVVRNLAWAKMVQSRIPRILRMEGAMPHMSGFFFKDIIHAVLLFRAENWVATPRMGKALGRFQTQVARRLTGKLTQRTTEGTWIYILAAA